MSRNGNKKEKEEESEAAHPEQRELQYEAGDRVELFNGQKGTITCSHMIRNTYDIDLGNGVFANQVSASDIKGKVIRMTTKQKEAENEEKGEIKAALDEQWEMEFEEEYIELEKWKEDNSSYMIGSYLFDEFEEEIKEVSKNAKKGDIVVYSPLQNRIYTIPPNADSLSEELIPLKVIEEEED